MTRQLFFLACYRPFTTFQREVHEVMFVHKMCLLLNSTTIENSKDSNPTLLSLIFFLNYKEGSPPAMFARPRLVFSSAQTQNATYCRLINYLLGIWCLAYHFDALSH